MVLQMNAKDKNNVIEYTEIKDSSGESNRGKFGIYRFYHHR